MEAEGPQAKRQKVEKEEEQVVPDEKVESEKVEAKQDAETSVGIRCFIGKPELAFSGILKERYSDFLVNEVDLQGNVVHLTDLKSIDGEEEGEEEEETKPDPEQDSGEKQLCELLGADKLAEVKEFVLRNTSDAAQPSKQTLTLPAMANKEKRSQLHRALAAFFPSVSTETVNGCVVVSTQKSDRDLNRSRRRQKRRGKKYLSFVLYKENKDTMEALTVLCRFLRIKQAALSYAGTKDKRGVTTQLVTASFVDATKLRDLNPKLYGIKVGNFKYVDKQLRLGELTGNQFTIIIRNISGAPELISESLVSIRDYGFINYYGLQRFGTTSIPTHHVGIELLKTNYEGAVKLILDVRDGDYKDVADAKRYFKETQDAQGTLQRLYKKGNKLFIETMLLRALAQCGPKQYINAIGMLPRNLRTMYVHSYQSYVWNEMASRRVEIYGSRIVVPGDVIMLGGKEEPATEVPEIDEDSKAEDRDEVIAEDMEAQHTIESSGVRVKIATDQDVAEGRFTPFDVVLPLPGHDVIYPSHRVGALYQEFMKQHGLDPENMRHKLKEFSLPGGYRRLLGKATQLEWRIRSYSDPKRSLLLTDLEKIQNANSCTQNSSVAAQDNSPFTQVAPASADEEGGRLKALELKFVLPASSYATMFFRELLKTSSSFPKK